MTSRDIASAPATLVSTWRTRTLYIATEGKATRRPTPVATRASAMPVITACVPWPWSAAPARSWNARMMPSTVPNRPTNGALLPSVPRNASRFS
ncbi:MAG TPA: hypothetical protein VHN14_22930 [Kofleriaceae bacterium]|jgi:hypothetical protein|nr:hypothetical protein [Kofleriaceae bacterium]